MTEPGRSGAKFDRVLVVDTNTATAKMLANLLRSLWPSAQVYGAKDSEKAMLLAAEVQPLLVFADAAGSGLDGMAFTREFRRSDLACREAPIIMIFGDVTAAWVLEARDSGVHEFMRRPYTMGDLQKRLDAVSGRPRDWIEAVAYVGPDRRRFNSADYKGPQKRSGDGSLKTQKMVQALKIVQSAVIQMDIDPIQAARALNTQARILIELTSGQDAFKRLSAATTILQSYLFSAAQQGGSLSKDQLQTYAANVLLAAPDGVKPSQAA